MDGDGRNIPAAGHLTMSDEAWEQARLRARVIGGLAARDPVGLAAADKAAVELGVSRRSVYGLLQRYREGSGLVTDLARRRSDGGRGANRLSEPVEQIIRELVRKRFLTRQKRSVASLHRKVARTCVVRGLPVPARNTVAARIARGTNKRYKLGRRPRSILSNGRHPKLQLVHLVMPHKGVVSSVGRCNTPY